MRTVSSVIGYHHRKVERVSNQAALIEHLRTHSLRTDGPFTLRSGTVSDWYLDARKTTYSGDGARLVGAAFLELLAPEVTAIGGMTMGADPLALATALAATGKGRRLNSFSIRKEAKDHGAGGRLVGPIGPDDVVAVVDDTVTTGGALDEAIEVLNAEGIRVAQALVLVDRSGGALAQLMDRRNLALAAILRPSDLGVR